MVCGPQGFMKLRLDHFYVSVGWEGLFNGAS